MKTYIIKSYSGVDVLDSTAYAEERLSSMDYIEERYKRDQKRKNKKLLYKLACMCGISC